MNKRETTQMRAALAASAVILVGGLGVATAAAEGESGAVPGAGAGPTLGVGDASSYTGNSTSNSLCGGPVPCAATLGVGDASSYTGAATSNSAGGSATQGVGDVNSYTGHATSGSPHNGTNSTTRTGNYGPGHPH